jgi:hypothetical protein
MWTVLCKYRALCTVYYPEQQMHNVVHLLFWIINYNVNLFSARHSHVPGKSALTSQKTWTSTFKTIQFTKQVATISVYFFYERKNYPLLNKNILWKYQARDHISLCCPDVFNVVRGKEEAQTQSLQDCMKARTNTDFERRMGLSTVWLNGVSEIFSEKKIQLIEFRKEANSLNYLAGNSKFI